MRGANAEGARFVVEAAAANHLDGVHEVAKHLNTVNLPADKELVRDLLDVSEQSFKGECSLPEREYVFVLIDKKEERVIGTSMIHAQHGTKQSPHVFFRVVQEERYSETLDHYVVHECLRLGYNYNGPTEIGGLILLPEYRGRPEKLGSFLSYMRFLYIAMHRKQFRDSIISELLPPLETDGTSKLWKHLGRRFTGLSYEEADRVSKNNKEFIRALFPHELIFTSLFPEDVRDVIGQVGPQTKGVEKMLRRIGFEYAEQIDPFDGGPHFVAQTDDVSLVKGSRKITLSSGTPSADSTWGIFANENSKEPTSFRCVTSQANWRENSAEIHAKTLELLGSPSQEMWCIER